MSLKTIVILIIVIFLGLGAFILPFLVGKIDWLNNYFSPNVSLPNYINGIATPVLYLLTSILLFLSFREQHVANELIKQQLKHNELNETRRRLQEEIMEYEKYIDKIGAIHKTSGGNILQTLFCDYINAVNHKGELETYKANPEKHLKEKHTHVYFALNQFEMLFNKITEINNEKLKDELTQKMHLLFEFYFNGVLSIGYFKSKLSKDNNSDFISNVHLKILNLKKNLALTDF